MPKRIISKSARWPGSVVLADPFTLSQVEAIEEALDYQPEIAEGAKVWYSAFDKVRVPVILRCVEKWELDNFPESPTVDTWPMTPRVPSNALILWLFQEIVNIYTGESEVPNE